MTLSDPTLHRLNPLFQGTDTLIAWLIRHRVRWVARRIDNAVLRLYGEIP